jgi:transcriptional regulator GlxA family with amidase domain
MTDVVFLVARGVHLLDLAGPAQVFSTAADLGLGYRSHFVGEKAETLSAQGLPLHTTVDWPPLRADDLVFVPGWRALDLRVLPLGKESLRRIGAHHHAGGTVASVCSGADALGRAGLLDGRRCTTHHDVQDELARRYTKATVIKDVLYVQDGRVFTSAGIASGIDLALHIIASRHGPSMAAAIAREMVVYCRRNGFEAQQSALLRHRAHLSEVVHHVQDIIEARFTEPLKLAALAAEVGCSERTVSRMFVTATTLTPLRYQQTLRLERAEHLIGHGSTVESAAHAVGFADPRMLRRLRSPGSPHAAKTPS